MRRLFPVAIALIALSMIALSCGESPSDVIKENVDAINRMDYGAVYDNFAPFAETAETYSRAEYIEMMEDDPFLPAGASIEEFEVVEEDVRGAGALVTWRGVLRHADGSEEPLEDNKVALADVNGEWKVVE